MGEVREEVTSFTAPAIGPEELYNQDKRRREWDESSVHQFEYEDGPESIPTRARFGFRISRANGPFELGWKVETWAKPPHVYMVVESQHLLDAIYMMIVARTHKSKE